VSAKGIISHIYSSHTYNVQDIHWLDGYADNRHQGKLRRLHADLHIGTGNKDYIKYPNLMRHDHGKITWKIK